MRLIFWRRPPRMPIPLRNLLIYRALTINALALCGLAFAHQAGWLVYVWETDRSRIASVIAAALAVTLGFQCARVVKVSRAINAVKAGAVASGDVAWLSVQRDKALAKIEWMGDAADWLLVLGLLGTVVGFIIALGGIDTTQLGSAQGAQRAVAELLIGVRVAVLTTIVGAIAGLWVQINRRLLYTSMYNYWCDRLLLGAGDDA